MNPTTTESAPRSPSSIFSTPTATGKVADPNALAANEVTRPVLRISWPVLREIVESIGGSLAEQGGPLGGGEKSEEITRFVFDRTARRSGGTYSPDTDLLNRLFEEKWNPAGLRLKGFVHSHPGRMTRPSRGDEIYAERILNAIPDLSCLWLPIVSTMPDTGEFKLTPWVVLRKEHGVQVVRGGIMVSDIPAGATELAPLTRAYPKIVAGQEFAEVRLQLESSHPLAAGTTRAIAPPTQTPTRRRVHAAKQALARAVLRVSRRVKSPKTVSLPAYRIPLLRRPLLQVHTPATFQRVGSAYDLERMRTSRIIAIGAGGAAEWLEQLARAGVGQFVLVDPDTVSETNLATQQTYRRDLGRTKVHCIADRLLDINPDVKVVTLVCSLDDLDDARMEALAWAPIGDAHPGQTVITGLTDNFWAQARVNRIALNLGLPSLCAQVYREGRGAEVTYTYPGVTPACHRCVLSGRYKHFLEHRQDNDVTSHGTPIFATSRLNALKGFVTLAILHHGTSHPRWGGMLNRLGKRNLALVRLDPDYNATLGLGQFDQVFAQADRQQLCFDETIWRPQEAECPATGHAPCPDCGGTGDLRDSIGMFGRTALGPPRGHA